MRDLGRRLRPAIVPALLLGIALLLGTAAVSARAQRFFPRDRDLLASVIRLIRSDYLEDVDPDATTLGAYRGLVNSLDPLSSYFQPETAARYEALDWRWKDVGVIVAKTYGLFPQVVGVRAGSPAEKAGLRVGDILSAFDGRSTMYMSLTEARLFLRDPEERPMTLRIVRGVETSEVKVTPATLFSSPYAFESLPDGRALLRIHAFAAPLVREIRTKLGPSLAAMKKPLIIDLRDCVDGNLEEARKFVNLFLSAPQIGRFEKKDGAVIPVAVAEPAAFPGRSIAVWVNAGTMGPAELAAGVLREIGRAKVLGAATPGLVAWTELFPLQDRSAVLLTSGIFVLPSGTKLWEKGVAPDVNIASAVADRSVWLEKTAAALPGF